MTFSPFTKLCNHFPYLVPEYHHPKGKPLCIRVTPWPQAAASRQPSLDLPCQHGLLRALLSLSILCSGFTLLSHEQVHCLAKRQWAVRKDHVWQWEQLASLGTWARPTCLAHLGVCPTGRGLPVWAVGLGERAIGPRSHRALC